jgi:hypothetical protein
VWASLVAPGGSRIASSRNPWCNYWMEAISTALFGMPTSTLN